jgi:hypothetical protein
MCRIAPPAQAPVGAREIVATGQVKCVGLRQVDLVTQVLQTRHGDTTRRIRGTIHEPGHQLVDKHGIAPMRVPRPGTAGVLYRDRLGGPSP